ncbi:hypothetical protein LSPCS325_29130 [Lysinibacillus sp. CTST325]
MDNLFAIVVLIGLLFFTVFGIKSLLDFIKKQDTKKNLKVTGISFVVVVVALAGVGVTASEVEKNTKKDNETLPVAVVDQSEKEYYLTQTKPYVDELLKKFDGTWAEFWKGTANKLSNSQITTKEAVNQYTLLKVAYQSVREKDMSPPVSGLSKNNQKKVYDFITNVEKAILKREEAADYAILTLRQNSPTHMDKAVELIKKGDTYVYDASVSLVTLENALDVESKENRN